jgi:hypothetical protein
LPTFNLQRIGLKLRNASFLVVLIILAVLLLFFLAWGPAGPAFMLNVVQSMMQCKFSKACTLLMEHPEPEIVQWAKTRYKNKTTDGIKKDMESLGAVCRLKEKPEKGAFLEESLSGTQFVYCQVTTVGASLCKYDRTIGFKISPVDALDVNLRTYSVCL